MFFQRAHRRICTDIHKYVTGGNSLATTALTPGQEASVISGLEFNVFPIIWTDINDNLNDRNHI